MATEENKEYHALHAYVEEHYHQPQINLTLIFPFRLRRNPSHPQLLMLSKSKLQQPKP